MAILDVLDEQPRYCQQRAGEYEGWWFRRGRYSHGDADARWSDETAALRELSEPVEERSPRRLAGGHEYAIVKHFFDAGRLQAELESVSRRARVGSTGDFFVYGELSPPSGT